VALVAGVVFGLLPALPARRLDLADAMKAGSRSVTVGGGRLRPALVVGEVALAVTVLIGAGLTLESLDHLSTVDTGFRAPGVLTAAVPASSRRYPGKEQWRGFYDELRDRAAALPGVRTAALALLLPLSHRSWELRAHPEGEPVDRAHAHSVLYNVVSPQYFATLSVPIIKGRAFTAADRDGAPLVAIIDQTMADQFWPGQDPIGRRLTLEERADDSTVVYRTVVGVTPNLRHYRLDAPSRIEVYVPIDQSFKRWGMAMRLAVRAEGDPAALAAPLRALVTSVDAEAPLFQVEPLASYVDAELARPRAMTRVLAAFGAAAAALVALGIFGVMSYDVTRRTREIAIRMAVGAAARDVRRWVGLRALRLTALGLAIGLVMAALVMRYLARLLYDVRALDPVSYGLAAAGLGLVALLAAAVPARRATRVDPVTVLNEE
jgi:putative ABC transport system permease protein